MSYNVSNNVWDSLELCLKKYSDLKLILEKNKDNRNVLIGNIIELYQFIKNISETFYIDNKMHVSYEFIINELLLCECYLKKYFLNDTKAYFDYNMEISNSENKILDYIVYLTRKYIYENNSCKDFNDIDLTNECEKISKYVNKICNELGIKSEIIKISPGFSEKANLLDGHGYHYFNIITINEEKYIIDCTYSQFFNLRQNILQRIGIPGLVSCNPGIYMLMDQSREKTSSILLKQGWIPMSDENIKNYFDGFALSYRNGLYYEKNIENKYATNYTSQDYINFIYGLDNQINHEPIESLGIQKRPLEYRIDI